MDDRWLKGFDPDCQLQTVKCHGVQERGSKNNVQYVDKAVEQHTKAKLNPKASDIAQLMGGLGSDMASSETLFEAPQKKDFLNTSVEFKAGVRNSMTATDYLMHLQEAKAAEAEGPEPSAGAAAAEIWRRRQQNSLPLEANSRRAAVV